MTSAAGGAVDSWHRCVVAVGAVSAARDGRPSRVQLAGSGFLIDTERCLLLTAAHVVLGLGQGGQPPPQLLIGLGSPIKWRYRAVVRRLSPPPAPKDPRNGLDLAVLQIVEEAPGVGRIDRRWLRIELSKDDDYCQRLDSKSTVSGRTSAALLAASTALSSDSQHPELPSLVDDEGCPVMGLPMADSDYLNQGDVILLLGYGQPATGATETVTPTRGIFSGRYVDEKKKSGEWLKTDALLLSGHSGGPALTEIGEVAGWSVRSQLDCVVGWEGRSYHPSGLAELRPINLALLEIRAVLADLEPSPVSSISDDDVDVRELLQGCLPAGTYVLGGAESERLQLAAAHMLGEMLQMVGLQLAGSQQPSSPGVGWSGVLPVGSRSRGSSFTLTGVSPSGSGQECRLSKHRRSNSSPDASPKCRLRNRRSNSSPAAPRPPRPPRRNDATCSSAGGSACSSAGPSPATSAGATPAGCRPHDRIDSADGSFRGSRLAHASDPPRRRTSRSTGSSPASSGKSSPSDAARPPGGQCGYATGGASRGSWDDDYTDEDVFSGSEASAASREAGCVRLRVAGLTEEVVADDQPTALYCAGKALRQRGMYVSALSFLQACQRALEAEHDAGFRAQASPDRVRPRSLERQLRECALEAELAEQGVLSPAPDEPRPRTLDAAAAAPPVASCCRRRHAGDSAPFGSGPVSRTAPCSPVPPRHRRLLPLVLLIAGFVAGCVAASTLHHAGLGGSSLGTSLQLLPTGHRLPPPVT